MPGLLPGERMTPVRDSLQNCVVSRSWREAMKARISAASQAVVRGPSLTGCGKRPALTPARNDERDMASTPFGVTISANRTRPNSGNLRGTSTIRRLVDQGAPVIVPRLREMNNLLRDLPIGLFPWGMLEVKALGPCMLQRILRVLSERLFVH